MPVALYLVGIHFLLRESESGRKKEAEREIMGERLREEGWAENMIMIIFSVLISVDIRRGI